MLRNPKKNWLAIAFLASMIALSASVSAQTVKSGIQKMSGWQNCTACAGAGGSGPTSTISMKQFISSPSLSGSAAQFSIAPTKPYSDALWWKQLGAVNTATNLVYNLYFYLKTPQYSQALEFDANQANGSRRWVFGTQCNIAAGHWDVWGNAAGNWISTGIPCSMPTAYKWHHLTWEFKRTATTVTFVAFTYDGVKHYVNRTYPAKTSGSKELNVAFQMDTRSAIKGYNTWVDNISLKYW